MNTWFISDLHLNDVFERNGRILLRFLFQLNENPKANRLVLLGDIFDVWVSDGAVFQNQFQLIIDQIVQLQKNGGEVLYFEGNHDVHIKKFWSRHGVQVFTEHVTLNLSGLSVRAEHGDYINPNDEKYLKWLAFMRSPFMEFLANTLPGFIWKAAAGKYSKKSRKKTSNYAEINSENIKNMIRKYVQDLSQKENFDVLITGHMHVTDDYTFEANQRKIRSINLGTWLDDPKTLKIDDNGNVSLIKLN